MADNQQKNLNDSTMQTAVNGGINYAYQTAGAYTAPIIASKAEEKAYRDREKSGFNKLLEDKQYNMQQRLNKGAQELNFNAMDKAYQQQKEMYDYTYGLNTIGAKKQQYLDAGMNPALAYGLGTSGSGGTTGSMPVPTVQGGSASKDTEQRQANIAAQAVAVQQMGIGLQMSKLQSEIAVNQAQAEKLKAEAKYTSGTQTELGQSNITNISQQTKNAEIQNIGMQLDNAIKTIDKQIAENTVMSNIKRIQFESDSAYWKCEEYINTVLKSDIDVEVKQRTIEQVVNSYNLSNDKLLSEIALNEAKTDVEKNTINQIIENIKILRMTNEFKQADIDVRKSMIDNEWNMMTERNKIEINKAWINAGTKIVDIASNFIPNPSKAINTIERTTKQVTNDKYGRTENTTKRYISK